MAQYVSEENLKLYDKLLKEYILTKSESLLDLLSYGVRWEKELKDPHLTRIGNLEWHRSLPLLSQMRGCIVQSPSKGVHVVKYWLHPDDWRFRKDNAGYVFNSEVSTIVENGITYYIITNSTIFSDLGYKRLYVKINGIIGLIIDITNNTAKIKLENTLDAGTYEVELGSRTNGYDGEVMVYMPGGYLHSVDAPTYSEVRISPFNVGGDWEYHKPGYISAYRITVLNTVPTNMGYLSTLPVNSAISVANVETYCRGGGNRPEYDLYLETDPFRSDLGKSIGRLTSSNARIYTRKTNSELLSYLQYKWLYWLYVIEYANFHSLEAFNSELTLDGFKLGGLGNGVTNISYSYWTYYNGNCAITPNGYFLQYGNYSISKLKEITVPSESGGEPNKSIIFNIPSYRGIEEIFGDVYIYLDGIILSTPFVLNEDSFRLVYITDNPDNFNDYSSIENMKLAGTVKCFLGGIAEFNVYNNAEIFPSDKSTITNSFKCDSSYIAIKSQKLLGIIIGGVAHFFSEAGICCINDYSGSTLGWINFRSFKELSMESIVITSDSNAPLMTAMYNAGLASNPDYMTKSEAEKVTTLNGIDFTNVVSFDEFKYFTGVTEIPNAFFLKNTSLTSIICPDSLITIGNLAFSTCSNLSYIKIGKYVTSIGDLAFAACPKLTNVIIPNFVTSISQMTFQYSGLKSIKLGNSLTSIGLYAFSNCSKLASIEIPDSVTFIGKAVFESCYKLTSLRISKYVTLINGHITTACNNLNEIIIEEGNPNYDSRNNCNAIIETSTNKLISGCKNTIIPNTVTSIDNYAFFGLSSLTSIIIPKSVTLIGNAAFRLCKNLTSITCLSTTAPTIQSGTFGDSATSYTGLNTHDQGVNKLYIPAGATGYDTGAWLDPLQNAEKCGFTIELLYAVKRETNPELMDICVANGWSANKDYMTYGEAAAITSDMIAPNEEYVSKFSTLTHFEEFLYFTGVKEIKDSTFYDCGSLTSIEIPDSVTLIGNDAFGECYELINITIPSSVTSIGNGAFYDCSSLTTINIPDSVISIDEYAFYDCSSLTTINIPDSVTSIGDSTFYGCSGLTSIIIPDLVTSINDNAFSNCSSLTSITIPNSVDYIGEDVFNYCSNLNTIVVLEGNTVYDSRNNCNAIIKTDTNILIIGCKNTIIPNSVTSIGSSAFSGCSGLISIIIPNSVTSIGNLAFYGCSGLTSITIPNSVTSILYYTFSGCSGLTSITIPDSVTSIDGSAFRDCSGLTSIEIPNSVTSIEEATFYGCSSLTSATIGNSVTSIGRYAFFNCSGLTSIEIPNSVTSIGEAAFSGCSGLTSITIPDSVTSISIYTFRDCSSLTAVTIPNSVTLIDYYTFENCSSLTSITIPNSVTSIGNYAFQNCSSLTSVTIPNSVTSIGNYAFKNCSGLTSVQFNAENYSDSSKYNAWLYNCNNITSFIFGENVKIIPAYLCYNLTKLTSVVIPDSVTSIGDYAFYWCSSLTSIVIPDSVTSIGLYIFYYCGRLTSVTIGNSVTSIGDYAFYGCSALTSITCLAATAPTVESSIFGNFNNNYTGRNTYNQGINKLKVPQGATGYDTGYWKDPLLNSNKCGFTIEYI